MLGSSRRNALALTLVPILAAALALPLIAATPTPPEPVVVLPPLDRSLIRQLSDPLRTALNDAQSLAEKNPDALGYPYVDSATGEVVLSAVNATGVVLLQQWAPTSIGALVRWRIRSVVGSYRRLEAIRNEAIGPGIATLPDSGLVYMTTQDDEHDRVIIVVDHRSDALFRALADRYGTELIAVRIEADPVFRSTGRQSDVTPFYGGAYIAAALGCTTAFSFRRSGSAVMLTAGHCAPTGHDVYTGANGGTYHQGYIYSSVQRDENWDNTAGTEYLGGGYYGDLALVTVDSGLDNSPYMYVGTNTSNTASPVKEMWSTNPQVGDQFCTGGSSTGELCGWQVTSALTNLRRGGCGNCPLAQNVTIGYKSSGNCLNNGDSGGPVYTVRPDSGIAAKGVMGSATNLGGTGNCQVEFTNIRYVPTVWTGTTLYTTP